MTQRGIKLFPIIRKTIKSETSYVFNTMSASVLGMLPVVIMIFLWKAVLKSGGIINDLRLEQIISYYFVAYIVSCIVDASEIAREISMSIRAGQINNFLIKPLSYPKYMLQKHVGKKIFQVITISIPSVIFYYIYSENINIQFNHLGWFLFSLIMAVLLNFYIFFFIGILSFWFIENGGLIQLWRNVMQIITGEKIPLYLFPVTVQAAFFILPFKYVVYFPVSILLEKNVDYGSLLVQVAWLLVMLLIVRITWNRGCRINEGVGI